MAVQKKTEKKKEDWKPSKAAVPESFRRLCQARIRVPDDAEMRHLTAVIADCVDKLEAAQARG